MALGHPGPPSNHRGDQLALDPSRKPTLFLSTSHLLPLGSRPNLLDLTLHPLVSLPMSQIAGTSKPPGCYLSPLAACLPFSPWWGSQEACNCIPDTDCSFAPPTTRPEPHSTHPVSGSALGNLDRACFHSAQ